MPLASKCIRGQKEGLCSARNLGGWRGFSSACVLIECYTDLCVQLNQACAAAVARQAFCWLCGEGTGREHTWTSISGHSCGRYNEETSQRVDEAQRNVKRYTACPSARSALLSVVACRATRLIPCP